MREALRAFGRWMTGKRRPSLLVVGAVIGFVAILASQLQPPDPESRLPSRYRLAALIQRQLSENEDQGSAVESLRRQIEQEREAMAKQQAGVASQNNQISRAGLDAGTVAMTGSGFEVTLDDSSLSSAPTGNINDLVIHSQDVQAAVNALWGAGAEAIAINGQRVVGTSAVLCVGNTLLINGTVHSPPYEIVSIGARRSTFNNDPLVRSLRQNADRFSLRFSVGSERTVEVPAFTGAIVAHYARPN